MTQQAKAVDISYDRCRPVSGADLGLMRRNDELRLDYPFTGNRMMGELLCQKEFTASLTLGLNHVSTLMRRMGIEELCRRPNTSRSHPYHRVYRCLLRGFAVTRLNQVWATDFTYIAKREGFV